MGRVWLGGVGVGGGGRRRGRGVESRRGVGLVGLVQVGRHAAGRGFDCASLGRWWGDGPLLVRRKRKHLGGVAVRWMDPWHVLQAIPRWRERQVQWWRALAAAALEGLGTGTSWGDW